MVVKIVALIALSVMFYYAVIGALCLHATKYYYENEPTPIECTRIEGTVK